MLCVCQIRREWVFHFHFVSYDFFPPLCDFTKLFIIILYNRSRTNTLLQYTQKPVTTNTNILLLVSKRKRKSLLVKYSFTSTMLHI